MVLFRPMPLGRSRSQPSAEVHGKTGIQRHKPSWLPAVLSIYSILHPKLFPATMSQWYNKATA